ncbi:hypothetical protein BE21_12790 [Sorangium cellulosum]|uniref:Uncharacterized protein n=1 Tax=Sorangium cellulosum TaxID=56 RepID=A0A150U050_SORCE|nr:hypothetical protein BE21_12790 [Sorangium cellulosum]
MLSAALVGGSDGVGSATDSRSGALGGQNGGVVAPCTARSEIIGVEDASRLGFSANDVVSAIAGARSATLTWAKGGSTIVTVSAGAPLAARFVRFTRSAVESAAAGDGPPDDPADLREAGCPGGAPLLEIDVPLRFSTDDGAFADSFPVTLRAVRRDAVAYIHVIHPSRIQGSYRITEIDPAEVDDVRLVLFGSIRRHIITGKLQGLAPGNPNGTGEGPDTHGRTLDVAEF